jgi:arylsulfatase A-like enzyme
VATRLKSAFRGFALGALAGAIWWIVELAVHRFAGSLIPQAVLLEMAGLDVAIAAGVGLVLGLFFAEADPATLALGITGAYGLMRVEPGLRGGLLFVAAAAGVVWVGRRLVGREREGVLGFVHVTFLATLAMLVMEVWLNESHAAAPPRGLEFLLGVAVLPLVALAVDRVVGVALARRSWRLSAEVLVGLTIGLLLGRPLSPGPLSDPLVTGVPPPSGTPDIILLSLDTTRADHLSTYGYGRETSPNITRFAADALLFEDAHSTVGWTLPSHASMLTGLYPSRHGARAAGSWLAGQSIDGRRNVARPLAPEQTTLAEVLRDRGYHTAAFVANFSYLYREFGLSQGFQLYEDAPWLLFRLRPPVVRLVRTLFPHLWLRPYYTGRDINAAALAWLDSRPRDRPAFLFLNYMEAHPPWLAPPPFDKWAAGMPGARVLASEDLYTHQIRHYTPEQREFMVANYDGQLSQADIAVGELMDALKARGRYENALIIVVADHGTLLGDHDQVGHIGRMLYEPLLHVPLIVKFPGADHPRGHVGTPAQTLDVFATAASVAGATPPPGMQGQVLPAVSHPILAEDEINAYLVSCCGQVYDRAVRVLVDGREKLITTSRGERMLFDVEEDPGETQNRAALEPERAEAMAQKLKSLLPFAGETGEATARPAEPSGGPGPAG